MLHGSRTKFHLLDVGWNYEELKCAWRKRGNVGRERRAINWYKRQFARAERRRGKRECWLDPGC